MQAEPVEADLDGELTGRQTGELELPLFVGVLRRRAADERVGAYADVRVPNDPAVLIADGADEGAGKSLSLGRGSEGE